MADESQLKCPHCGQTYAVRPGQWPQYHGQTINCTKCGQSFTVTAPPEALASLTPPPVPGGAPPLIPDPAAGLGYGGPGGQMYVAAPTEKNGWALASLIVSIISFCVPLVGGIVAIVLGIVGLTKTRDPRVGGKGMAITGISLGGVSILVTPFLALMISIMLPALNRAREQANRIKCAANEKQIGMALMMYASSNSGHYPDKLEDVLQSDPSMAPGNFICPSDDKSPASTSSVKATAHDISTGQHCSYIYLGADLTSAAPADVVLLYEPLTDHSGQGMNVLFADGTVQWMAASQAQTIITQQESGKRPVLANPTTP